MKLKKPVPVRLFGEEVQVIELKTEGRMAIRNSEGIKDTVMEVRALRYDIDRYKEGDTIR